MYNVLAVLDSDAFVGAKGPGQLGDDYVDLLHRDLSKKKGGEPVSFQLLCHEAFECLLRGDGGKSLDAIRDESKAERRSFKINPRACTK